MAPYEFQTYTSISLNTTECCFLRHLDLWLFITRIFADPQLDELSSSNTTFDNISMDLGATHISTTAQNQRLARHPATKKHSSTIAFLPAKIAKSAIVKPHLISLYIE